MKHFRLVLLALPLLLAAGCQTLQNTNSMMDNSKALGAPSVISYSYADKWTDKGIDRCQYILTYPELMRPRTWTPEEPPTDPILERANQEIQRAYGLLTTTGTVALTPQAVASEFMNLCKTDLADMLRELGKESIDNINYTNESSFTVHLLTPKIASLSIETYSFLGGAHGNPSLDSVNIDLTTGQRLVLKNIIKNDQLRTVMQSAYAKIINTYKDGLFEESRTTINKIINDKTEMSAIDQGTKFGDTINFFLTGEGIIFFWNTYEITPYAAGQPMAFMSWQELRDKLLITLP